MKEMYSIFSNVKEDFYYLLFETKNGKKYMKELKIFDIEKAREILKNKHDLLDKRLSLYNKYPIPSNEKVKELFTLFLKYKDLNKDELLLLRLYLTFDKFVLFERPEANDILSKKDNGSWLIRTSNIKTKKSDVLSCLTISYKNDEIKSIIVFHAKGYGYYLPDQDSDTFPVADEYGNCYLPLLGENKPFPKPKKTYSCFIDVLVNLNLDFSKYIA